MGVIYFLDFNHLTSIRKFTDKMTVSAFGCNRLMVPFYCCLLMLSERPHRDSNIKFTGKLYRFVSVDMILFLFSSNH